MKKFVSAVSVISLCLLLAGCGKDGKDGANGKDGINGKDGVAGKDGLTFRVVDKIESGGCAPNETLASATCMPTDGSMLAVGVAPGFQTPNNAGEQNVVMATCPKLTVRLICAPK